MVKVMFTASDEGRMAAEWMKHFPEVQRYKALHGLGYELSTTPVSSYRQGTKHEDILRSQAKGRFLDYPVRKGFDVYLATSLIPTRALPLAHLIVEEKSANAEGLSPILEAMETAGITKGSTLTELRLLAHYAERVLAEARAR